MDYRIDTATNKLVYMYQLRAGACPSSFGLRVAEIAGLPKKVMELAGKKCEEFRQRNSHLELQTSDIIN